MVRVPKEHGNPGSLLNSRGVLCSDSTAKVYSRVLRAQLAPVLPAYAGDLQSGGVLGGGTEGPAFAVHLHLQKGRALNSAVGVVFADMKSAFYAIMPEVILGKLLTMPGREATFAAIGMSTLEVEEFSARFLEQPALLSTLGVKDGWLRALKDWHSDTGSRCATPRGRFTRAWGPAPAMRCLQT